MAYNAELAELVRQAITGVKGVTEKKMFGGIAFMANDRMLIGVDKNDLIIRCEKEETDELLKKKGVRVFDLSGGRPMKGWRAACWRRGRNRNPSMRRRNRR